MGTILTFNFFAFGLSLFVLDMGRLRILIAAVLANSKPDSSNDVSLPAQPLIGECQSFQMLEKWQNETIAGNINPRFAAFSF